MKLIIISAGSIWDEQDFEVDLTYISLSWYLAAKFCKTPGSCKYDNLVMSSTPPGGASSSLGNMFANFVTI